MTLFSKLGFCPPIDQPRLEAPGAGIPRHCGQIVLVCCCHGTATRVIVAPWRQAFRRRASNHMPTAARPTARCVDGSGTAVMVAPCRPLSTLTPSWEL